MLENAFCVLQFLESYGEALVADIDPADFCLQPTPGLNHPAWIFDHLSYASDRHATLLGVEQRLVGWKGLFAKGSLPQPDPLLYPPKDELMGAWKDANSRLVAAIQSTTAARLASPNEYLKNGQLPTLRDFFTYSMTGHTAMHLGQVSAWRRACGCQALAWPS